MLSPYFHLAVFMLMCSRNLEWVLKAGQVCLSFHLTLTNSCEVGIRPIPYFMFKWEMIYSRWESQKTWVRVSALSLGSFPSWFWCQTSVCFDSTQICLSFHPVLMAISIGQSSFSKSRSYDSIEEIWVSENLTQKSSPQNLVQWLLRRIEIWYQRKSGVE